MRVIKVLTLAAAILLLVVLVAGCKTTSSTDKGGGQSAGSAPAPGQAGFQEFPLGDEQQLEDMNIAGVYFQAVEMEPGDKAGLGPDEADIHLEADIHAAKGNEAGFGVGEWIPNLTVSYKVTKIDTGEEVEGSFMPMNASDGPHYGSNIKMSGAGKYQVVFTIESPEKQGYLLHVDKETGVAGRFWRKPLEVSWEFDYVPLK